MARITGNGLFVVTVLTAALARLIVEEVSAWSPAFIRSLIKLAVRRLPENRRERFGEEWQSHINDVPGQVGKLLVAVGFFIAAYDIRLSGRRNQAMVTLMWRVDGAHSAILYVFNVAQRDTVLAGQENKLRELVDLALSQARQHQGAERSNAATAIATTFTGSPSTTLPASMWHSALQYMRMKGHVKRVVQSQKQMLGNVGSSVTRIVKLTG
jgi:hypothetical protein